jgi:hypothetical protein
VIHAVKVKDAESMKKLKLSSKIGTSSSLKEVAMGAYDLHRLLSFMQHCTSKNLANPNFVVPCYDDAAIQKKKLSVVEAMFGIHAGNRVYYAALEHLLLQTKPQQSACAQGALSVMKVIDKDKDKECVQNTVEESAKERSIITLDNGDVFTKNAPRARRPRKRVNQTSLQSEKPWIPRKKHKVAERKDAGAQLQEKSEDVGEEKNEERTDWACNQRDSTLYGHENSLTEKAASLAPTQIEEAETDTARLVQRARHDPASEEESTEEYLEDSAAKALL